MPLPPIEPLRMLYLPSSSCYACEPGDNGLRTPITALGVAQMMHVRHMHALLHEMVQGAQALPAFSWPN